MILYTITWQIGVSIIYELIIEDIINIGTCKIIKIAFLGQTHRLILNSHMHVIFGNFANIVITPPYILR